MTIERPIGRPGPTWTGASAHATAGAETDWRAPAPGAAELVPCSFRRRFAALGIDQAIAWGTVLVVAGILGTMLGVEEDPAPGSRDEQILEALGLVAFVAPFAYFWIWNAAGFTPGKQMLGLRIVNDRGETPGLGRGFARTVASLLVPMTCGIAYLWALWDASETRPLARGRRQGWHDKVSGTRIVRG